MTDDRDRIVAGLDEAEYHAHPALSVSGAKKLLPPSCPALYRHERDNPPEKTKALDYGSAAHKLLLGSGPEIAVIDAPSWQPKYAQAGRDAAHLAGRVPLLAKEKCEIDAMVAALRAHALAAALFEPGTGNAEVSAFWHDPTFGVDRRARFDWLPFTDGGRLILPDYKTTVSASPSVLGKTIAKYRYHMQAAWYRDLAYALEIAEEVVFLLVFQEKKAPYLVTVAEIDADGMRMGTGLNDLALETFAQCSATNTWPGYTDDVQLVSLPTYAHYEFHEITEDN